MAGIQPVPACVHQGDGRVQRGHSEVLAAGRREELAGEVGVPELCPWNSQKLHPHLRKPNAISPAWICNDYFLLRRGPEGSGGLLGIRE